MNFNYIDLFFIFCIFCILQSLFYQSAVESLASPSMKIHFGKFLGFLFLSVFLQNSWAVQNKQYFTNAMAPFRFFIDDEHLNKLERRNLALLESIGIWNSRWVTHHIEEFFYDFTLDPIGIRVAFLWLVFDRKS